MPNPLFQTQPREMVTTLLENRKQILVTSYTDFLFHTYNINDRTWSLAPAVSNLPKAYFFLSSDMVKSVGVGNMLYRVSFDNIDHPKVLVIQAFDLHLDQWFEGCLNVGREIFGEYNEVLGDGYPCYVIRNFAYSFNPPTIRTQTQKMILIGGEAPISNLVLHLFLTCILWFLKFQLY